MSELERIINECLGEELPYCQAACPLHVDVQGYVRMVRQGKYDEALQIIRRTLPFPGILGRICTHPCESACKRRDVDEALAIADLKRAANDHGTAEEDSFVNAEKGEKVAVIGGGPAGIMAAYDLRKMGYRVTIFEALPYLGGMLAAAIPDFRLPRGLVKEELSVLEKLGVEINLNTRVGDSLTLARLKKSFDAVIVATGAPLSRKLNIEGSTLQGVLWGLDFLRAVKEGDPLAVSGRVIVIGGGNVAIDAALSAIRLGAGEVKVICLERRQEMPAFPSEIEQAEGEGVTIETSWGPKRILGDGRHVAGIEVVRCVSVFDKTGQFNPSFDEGETKVFSADTVILAIGQQTDLSCLDTANPAMTRGGLICADNLTLLTLNEGVFACGDVVTGPKSVVDALAAGRRAGVSVDRYLRGEDLVQGREHELLRESKLVVSVEGYEKKKRCPMPLRDLEERRWNFTEVELGFSVDQAQAEGDRCIECQCKTCVQECEFLKDLNETPKALARKLKEGLFREDRRLAYRCNICDLCKRNCENDLSLGDMFMEIRQTMVKEGLGPLSEHQFVKREQDFTISDKFALVQKDPGMDRCERIFFPGCGLSGYSPNLVIETYEHLHKQLPGTGLILGCCGGPTRFLGDESRFREIIGKVTANMKALGATELIMACPDCYHTFRHCEPDLKVRPVSAILFEAGLPVESLTEKGQIFSLHDSCKARWEKEWQDSVRTLVKKLGHEIEEVGNSRDKTRCCGLGGMVPYVDLQLSARITRKRADEFPRDILTYCAGCREALAMFKPALHVLDLVFNADWQKVKYDLPKTGKARRENQARLKQMLLDRYFSSCTKCS